MKNKLKLILTVLVLSISIINFNGDAYADSLVGGYNPKQVVSEFATKAPMGKRQLAMKFLLAMAGVATSSVLIFVILSIYNKCCYGGRSRVVINEDDNEFKTPTNMKEAINIFLKKTK